MLLSCSSHSLILLIQVNIPEVCRMTKEIGCLLLHTVSLEAVAGSFCFAYSVLYCLGTKQEKQEAWPEKFQIKSSVLGYSTRLDKKINVKT